MEQARAFVEWLKQAGPDVLNVWPQFLIACCIIGLVIWRIMGGHYQGRIETKDAQIEYLRMLSEGGPAQSATAIANFELRPPDYDKWIGIPRVRLAYACWVLAGYEPPTVNPHNMEETRDLAPPEVETLTRTLKDAALNQALPGARDVEGIDHTPGRQPATEVSWEGLIQWYETEGRELPEILKRYRQAHP